MPRQIKEPSQVSVAALDQHVRSLDRDLTGLEDRLDKTMTRFEDAVRFLTESLEKRFVNIEQRFQPQYQVWIAATVAVGLAFGAFWKAGIDPIHENQVNDHTHIERIDRSLDDRVWLFTTRQAHDDFKKDMDHQLDVIRKDSKEALSRSEFQTWEKERGKTADLLQQQINDVNRQIAASILAMPLQNKSRP